MKRIIMAMLMVCVSAFSMEWEVGKGIQDTYKKIDGDTVWIQTATETFKARLIAIDTFETKVNHRAFIQLETLKMLHKDSQTITKVLAFGHKAKEYTASKVINKEFKFERFGKDKYGRTLVWIEGVNYQLVRIGLAIYYPNNLIQKEYKAFLLEASREANLEKRGIYE